MELWRTTGVPRTVNPNNTLLTAGLLFNQTLPLPIHNTMSLGYEQNRISQQFVPEGTPRFKPEHGAEFNAAGPLADATTAAGDSVLRGPGRKEQGAPRFSDSEQGSVLRRREIT
jgi:hypothetical protein